MRQTVRSPFPLLAAIALLVVLGAVAACGGGAGEEGAPATTGMEEEPVDVGPEEAATAVERIALGSAVADDGSIAESRRSSEFTVGDTVYVAFELDPDSAATEVEVSWYGPDGLEVDSDQAVVEPGQEYANFEIGTAALEPGTYRGEVWYGNELVEEFEFTVNPAA